MPAKIAKVKVPVRKTVRLSAFLTKLCCKECNDAVYKYVNLEDETVDSWFCRDAKCKYGIFHRTYNVEPPAWTVTGPVQNVDIREKE